MNSEEKTKYMIEFDLYKERSYSDCVREANNLICANFATIFRHTWIGAVAAALIGGLFVFLSPPMGPGEEPTSVFLVRTLLQIIVFVIYVFCVCWMNTGLFCLLTQSTRRQMLLRCARQSYLLTVLSNIFAFLLAIIIIIATTLLNSAVNSSDFYASYAQLINSLWYIIIICAAWLIVLIVLLPAAYSSMKYIIEGGRCLQTIFKKPYAEGWKHWGYLALVALIGLIIVAVVSVIVCVPVGVLTVSEQTNAAGVIMGDASDLPSYFEVLKYLVAVITGFVMLYAILWFEILLYFAYGHIEKRVRDVAERKEKENGTNKGIVY